MSGINIEKRLQNKRMGYFMTAVLTFLMLLICFINALEVYENANFYPINGTYQDYNPVRRLLAGQVPIRDFVDYLGLGHLFAGGLLTGLLGGTYTASRVAFRFLSLLSLGLLSFVMGRAMSGKTNLSLAIANFFLIFAIVTRRHFRILEWPIDIAPLLQSAVTTGNSARFIRGMILPLSCLGILCGMKLCSKLPNRYLQRKNLCISLGFGILAGICFIWSNDYGISCWLCTILMAIFIVYARSKKFGITACYGALTIVTSCACIFILIQIITLGHFTEWFQSTFGTGSYQRWYYLSHKSYLVLNLDFSAQMTIQAILTIVYLSKMASCGGSRDAIVRFGIPAYANMTSFCAVNEYRLLSGASAREMATAVLCVTLLFELGNFLSAVHKKKYCYSTMAIVAILIVYAWVELELKIFLLPGDFDSVEITIALLGASFLFALLGLAYIFLKKEQLYSILLIGAVVLGFGWTGMELKSFQEEHASNQKSGTYVAEFGGRMDNYEDIYEVDKFLNGEKCFSTYASAQEAFSGTFQPSGVDYIIHVLGDPQREKYMESFHNGDFRYVSTIRDDTPEEYSKWELWVKRANWFFYRDLYQNWHPVFKNSYAVYWERNKSNNENEVNVDSIDIKVERIHEKLVKIVLNTDPAVNGTADVYLDYAVKKQDRVISNLVFSKMLQLSVLDDEDEFIDNTLTGTNDDFGNWFLRPESKEYIPIEIKDGYGELYLVSAPVDLTYLEVYEVKCDTIFSVPGVSE